MIRPFANRDREKVLDLLRATGNFNRAELDFADEVIAIIVGQPDQRDYYSFVAETMSDADAGITGFLVIGPVPATVGSWDVYWIAVQPGSYGKGIATALQLHAEDFVRRRGGYWLLVETSSQPSYERARSFYRKQGYCELARLADYYRPSEDLIIFGKRLGS